MTVIFWQFDSSPLPSNFRCSSRSSFQILSKFSFFSACFYHVTCVFIVNLLSTIVWMSSNSFLETGTVSEIYMTTTEFEPITTLTKWSSVVYELSWCGFDALCSHLNSRNRAFFEQWVLWHSGNYRLQITLNMYLHDKITLSVHHTDKYSEHISII